MFRLDAVSLEIFGFPCLSCFDGTPMMMVVFNLLNVLGHGGMMTVQKPIHVQIQIQSF